jgi:hypothetical protein
MILLFERPQVDAAAGYMRVLQRGRSGLSSRLLLTTFYSQASMPSTFWNPRGSFNPRRARPAR